MAYPSRIALRLIVAAIIAAFAATFAQPAPVTGADPKAAATPVLVELFTSEGCSDCPPADDLVARLDAEQFVPGAYAIVLSEHVTYWNHQGWRDPFSFDAIDRRQTAYQERFHLDSAYTPQIVVDGTQQFVGNVPARLTTAVETAAAQPKQPLTIADAVWQKDGVHFSVRTALTPGSHLVAALAEDSARTEVLAGENARRTLHHVAVVRTMKEFNANVADGRPLTLSTSDVNKGKNAVPLRLVVFLANDKTAHIEAVAQQKLDPPAR